MEWSETYSVKELVKIGVLERPIDGNHGSYHPTATDYVSKGIPFVMASDLKNGVIDYENCKFITHERAKKLQKGFAKKNDILLTHKATIGRTAIVKELSDSDFIMLTPQVTYYRVKDYNRLNNQFLRYYFESQKFQEILSQWAGAGSTRAYIGITNQLDLPIFIPPLSKQKRIAHILGSLDDKIEINRKMNETLEQMALALFKSWFVDFDPVHAKAAGKKPFGMDDATAALFPDSFEESELGLIPKGWRLFSLYEIAEWQNGMTFKDSHFTPAGYPIIKIAELKNGITNQTKKSNKHHELKFCIDDGDILFSWSGSPDTSIDTFIWSKGISWLNQHIFKVSPKKTSKNWMFFLLKCLKPVFIEIARNKQTTGLGHITVNDLKNMYFSIPDENVLNRYEIKYGHLFKLVSNFLKENDSLFETRNLILPLLIHGNTGEVI